MGKTFIAEMCTECSVIGGHEEDCVRLVGAAQDSVLLAGGYTNAKTSQVVVRPAGNGILTVADLRRLVALLNNHDCPDACILAGETVGGAYRQPFTALTAVWAPEKADGAQAG